MKNEEIRQRTREKIFNSAIACFNESGYHKASMDKIAARAGITKRTLYYHFKSKDDLFIELFHFRGKKYYEQMSLYISETDNPEEQINLFVRKGTDIVSKNKDFLRFFVEFMTIGARNTAVGQVMNAYYRDSIKNFKKYLLAGIQAGKFREHDVERTARAVFIFSMGIFFIDYSFETDFDLVEQHMFDIDKILKDIKQT